MQRVSLAVFTFCLIIILIGCQEKQASEEISPYFISGNFRLQGIEGRIGVLTDGFVAGKGNKYMWHFWFNNEEEINREDFKVEGVELKTGKVEKVLVVGSGTDDQETVWKYEGKLGGPNNGADAHIPSSIEIPTPGLWRLDAYLGDVYFGSITILARGDS
ncbi:DUF4871 domain-containing protein [Paenibacillus eucommiae]|uniref:DUF4871 domain-containing protein n=1 Tax=Paenibacillus eucommiae TaxID=1355755 RepID=A0ABS4IPE8_9BACL|nr:DUF4871 domain-containing protein [Paenibacillus eucommiae]MBP1989434.1 hypothetical protein [Paenibacillus eucommiae]